MLAFPISLLPKFTSKSSVMNVTWDRKREEERERGSVSETRMLNILWKCRSESLVYEKLVHWKAMKSVEISAFVISIPFEFNAMWRHKVLYQSHGILQWTCATPPISTPTQRHLMFGMERSCYQPRNWMCVCLHNLCYALLLITRYGIENATKTMCIRMELAKGKRIFAARSLIWCVPCAVCACVFSLAHKDEIIWAGVWVRTVDCGCFSNTQMCWPKQQTAE